MAVALFNGVSKAGALQVAEVDDTTEGGLLMAGSSKEKPTLGMVRTPVDLAHAMHQTLYAVVHKFCSMLCKACLMPVQRTSHGCSA